jgi:HEAT repeat protein
LLRRLFQIQRGEGRVVTLVVGMMFVAVAGGTFGESGISALFFDRVGPDSLPVMYLAQGAIGLVAMLVLAGVLGRFDARRMYVALPAALAAIVVVERLILVGGPTFIYPALYLTTSVAALTQGVSLWGLAGAVTDTRRARRLFPLFSSGYILGSVLGGLVTKPLAAAIGAENLLVVWAVALIATAGLAAVAVGVRRAQPHRERRRSTVAEMLHGFGFVKHSQLLRWMTASAVLFSVLFYSLYLPFVQAATARYTDPDALAGFFGLFWAAVTAAAFVVSVGFANRLLRWIGAATAMLLLPILYGAAFATLFVTSTFATLVTIRFAVNVWLQGVSSPAWEAIVNVTPGERRDQVRAFLNGGPSQVGTAIAGVIALVGQQALSAGQLSAIGFVTAIVMIFVGWKVRTSYPGAINDAIRIGRPNLLDAPLPNVPVTIDPDAEAMDVVVRALEDRDTRVRRLAVHLVAEIEDERAVGPLETAARDTDADVRVAAVAALAARDSPSSAIVEALADEDAGVRLAAVRGARPETLSVGLLEDGDPRVADAAASRLLATTERPKALSSLERMLASDDPFAVASALEELAASPSDDVTAFAVPRVGPDLPTAVRVAALRALANAGAEVAGTIAMQALADPNAAVVDAAISTLDGVTADGVGTSLAGEAARIQRERAETVSRDVAFAAAITDTGDAAALLRDALLERARRDALVALSAATVRARDRAGWRLALDILRDRDAENLPNALESVETTIGGSAARILLLPWEPSLESPHADHENGDVIERLESDRDELIRSCAALVGAEMSRAAATTRNLGSMSRMEFMLALRRIDLFATLEPTELERVASIAEEAVYDDGALIGSEGDLGDELHIIIEGEVSVTRDGATIATRGAGDVVGEMSLITRQPRMASLVAAGTVRTVRIGYRDFEVMVRERPDILLGVARVLAERLAARADGQERSSTGAAVASPT